MAQPRLELRAGCKVYVPAKRFDDPGDDSWAEQTSDFVGIAARRSLACRIQPHNDARGLATRASTTKCFLLFNICLLHLFTVLLPYIKCWLTCRVTTCLFPSSIGQCSVTSIIPAYPILRSVYNLPLRACTGDRIFHVSRRRGTF